LLAASSLSAQSVLSIGGAGGVANETYSTAISTTGGKTLSLAFNVEYLLVGGGGAGGTGGGLGGENNWGGGGGGAGGVLAGSLSIGAQSYTVTVGAGGAAASFGHYVTTNGASGTKSVFSTYEALGGGGGAGSNNSSTGGVGLSGGSGGGGGGDGLKAGGTGIDGQGFGGGTSRTSAGGRAAGGGGGGAGAVGQIGGPTDGHNSGVGGNGGAGIASSITGSSVTYGGGGGGGGRDTNSGSTSRGGSGGTGGGGAGSGQGNATSGTDGTGGGGGGSGADGNGGDGGDGIVIVRYKGSSAGTGGTVSSGTGSAAGYTLHTFTTVGNAALDLGGLDLGTRLGADVTSSVTGTGALNIDTEGTIVYRGNATHTGGTNVLAGTFQLGNNGVHGSLAGSAVTIASGATFAISRSDLSLNLNSSFSGAGIFVKKGSNQVNLEGDFSGLSGSIVVEGGVLQLGGFYGNAYGTNYNVAAGISGAGAIKKDGQGTLVLSGNLTHTGGTTVSKGTLVINGTHDGDVTVLTGASVGILGGSGTILGDTVVYGFHSPGNSPGVQTLGNLTYQEGSRINWELGANTTSNTPLAFDQIIVTGDLDFAGATELNLVFDWSGGSVDWTDAFWNVDRSWEIMSVQGDITGFENLSIFTPALVAFTWQDSNGVTFANARANGDFHISLSGSSIFLNYSAIPEPSTYGLAIGGLALALAAYRRRNKSSK
jgi:hypothetical protein